VFVVVVVVVDIVEVEEVCGFWEEQGV
jgi:hypothetical protein